jgi:hypothetical protein
MSEKDVPRAQEIIRITKIDPYIVEFRDSERNKRMYYAFRVDGTGKYFLVDVTPDDQLLAAPINVPKFEALEKVGTRKLHPRMVDCPAWLGDALNAALAGEGSEPVEEEKKDEVSPAMQAAAMGEDDGDEDPADGA